MTEDEERMKNLIFFKVRATDKELGLDGRVPVWVLCVGVGAVIAAFVVVLFF